VDFVGSKEIPYNQRLNIVLYRALPVERKSLYRFEGYNMQRRIWQNKKAKEGFVDEDAIGPGG
jgi:hypothetical protein